MIATPKHLAVERICELLDVSVESLYGNSRESRTILARRVVAVVLHEDHGMSFPEIALMFGKDGNNRAAWMQYQHRDDADVSSALATVRAAMRSSESVPDRLASLESQVATLRQMVCNRLTETPNSKE